MTEGLSHYESMLELAVSAVALSRTVTTILFEVVIPTLPPHRCALAEQVKRGLVNSAFLDGQLILKISTS